MHKAKKVCNAFNKGISETIGTDHIP